MIFESEIPGIWLAEAVDSINCVQGNSIEDLIEHWTITAAAYQQIHKNLQEEKPGQEIWEPPKPFEYEAVWEAGTPCDFIDGFQARMVDYNTLRKASDAYQVRINSYGLCLSDEEHAKWKAEKAARA